MWLFRWNEGSERDYHCENHSLCYFGRFGMGIFLRLVTKWALLLVLVLGMGPVDTLVPSVGLPAASAQTGTDLCTAAAELPQPDPAVPSVQGLTITSMTGTTTAETGRYWVRLEWQPLPLEGMPGRCILRWNTSESPPLFLGGSTLSETVAVDETFGGGALPGEERCYRLVVISGEARSEFTEACYTVPLPPATPLSPATGSAGLAAGGGSLGASLLLVAGLGLLLSAAGLAGAAGLRRLGVK
jgi:hypothetical protein